MNLFIASYVAYMPQRRQQGLCKPFSRFYNGHAHVISMTFLDVVTLVAGAL